MARFFDFPNPVNDVAARAVASGVIVLAALAIGVRALWLTIPLAYGFVARTAFGPRISPLGLVATRVVAPMLPRYKKLIPGPPKRFAQFLGSLFSLTALTLWLAGESTASYVILAILLVPATAEAVLGFCVGCEMFRIAMGFGLIPQSVCEECADLWGSRRSGTRRAQINTE